MCVIENNTCNLKGPRHPSEPFLNKSQRKANESLETQLQLCTFNLCTEAVVGWTNTLIKRRRSISFFFASCFQIKMSPEHETVWLTMGFTGTSSTMTTTTNSLKYSWISRLLVISQTAVGTRGGGLWRSVGASRTASPKNSKYWKVRQESCVGGRTCVNRQKWRSEQPPRLQLSCPLLTRGCAYASVCLAWECECESPFHRIRLRFVSACVHARVLVRGHHLCCHVQLHSLGAQDPKLSCYLDTPPPPPPYAHTWFTQTPSRTREREAETKRRLSKEEGSSRWLPSLLFSSDERIISVDSQTSLLCSVIPFHLRFCAFSSLLYQWH